MALAENHRTALKMEATCIAAATTGNSGNNSGIEIVIRGATENFVRSLRKMRCNFKMILVPYRMISDFSIVPERNK